MSEQQPTTERSFSPYLPLFLLALAVLTNLGFQTINLANEAEQLKTAIAGQQKAIEEGQKMRSQLQQMSRQALELANGGNSNAAELLEAMRKKGVKIQGTPESEEE
ncbi:MAG: hypothetical protein VW985_13115 [Gammaproteobacteria bacterium]